MGIDIWEDFNRIIKKNISEGKTGFVICMFGRNGLFLKDLLNRRYGITEEFIIDNELSLYNKKVVSLTDVKHLTGNADLQYIITSNVESFVNELKMYVDAKQIHNPFSAERTDSPVTDVKIGKYSYGPLVEAVKSGISEIEKIGSFCSFAPGTSVVWNHPTNLVTTHEFTYADTNCKDLGNRQMFNWEEINRKCIIGNDVWLGQNVIITNGAHIGNGVIAGAGSIITKDVPDYAVIVGCPAQIIRYRFTPEQIQKLNEIKWWDWPDEKIRETRNDFLNIDVFLERHYVEKD